MLAPIITIFQWSGLSPFPLVVKKGKSVWLNDKSQFIAIVVANLLTTFFACIQNLLRFNPIAEGPLFKLIVYINVMVVLSLHIHTVATLIESYSKRSIEVEVLTKFQEIENSFQGNFGVKTDNLQQRNRFRKFIIIWIVKNAIVAILLVGGTLFSFKWDKLSSMIVIIIPFYTSTLSNAQWMTYVDVIRSNVERLNECLREMSDGNSMIGRIFHVETFQTDMFDMCERLVQLRKYSDQLWQASALINRRFCWSLSIGIGSDLILLVINLYWILFCMVHLKFGPLYDIIFRTAWTSMILSNFSIISLIGEDINAKVSRHFPKIDN